MPRTVVFMACCGATACALGAAAAIATEEDAAAQSRIGAVDAGPSTPWPCTFVASGGVSSSGACKAFMVHRPASDASRAEDGLGIAADSANIRSVGIFISFAGAPQSGILKGRAPAGTLPFTGRAMARSLDGVEYLAFGGNQGTFRLTLTSIRAVPGEGGTSYELHGDLEIEMPVASSNSRPPKSPLPPLTLFLSF